MFHFFEVCYNIVIKKPLFSLYLNGPSYLSFGFWGGMSEAEICAKETSYSELFWIQNSVDCQEIIASKFNSWFICFEIVVYFFCLYKLIMNLSWSIYFFCFQWCCIKKLKPLQHQT